MEENNIEGMDESLHRGEDALDSQLRQQHDFSEIASKLSEVITSCQKVIIGQGELIELMITCLLSDGHILIEGVPGIAKTLSAKAFAKALRTEFSRIQFTPDLMPADIIGTSIFNMKESEFIFKKGPIFSNIVLIDEINRAPAKTQSALFEVMAEKQLTYDDKTYIMSDPFLVLATQNPIEQEGTYRLPEAQLDRFMMKIKIKYPSTEDEIKILSRFKNTTGQPDLSIVDSVLTHKDIADARTALKQIYVEDGLLSYIATLISETRQHAKLYLGASPRASLAMLQTAKMVALINNRDFVIPEDLQYVAPYILNHRLILTPEAEMEGLTTEDVITDIIKSVEIPR